MDSREYYRLCAERTAVIRENAGRRIKGLPQLPVPPVPVRPHGWELKDEQGDYAGFTLNESEKDEFLAGHNRRKAILTPAY